MLGVDPKRVYGLIDRGCLTAYDLNRGQGNRWLKIDRASVVAFLESCKIKPPERVSRRYAA